MLKDKCPNLNCLSLVTSNNRESTMKHRPCCHQGDQDCDRCGKNITLEEFNLVEKINKSRKEILETTEGPPSVDEVKCT